MDLTIWEDELKTIPYYLDEIEYYRNRVAILEKKDLKSRKCLISFSALIDYLRKTKPLCWML